MWKDKLASPPKGNQDIRAAAQQKRSTMPYAPPSPLSASRRHISQSDILRPSERIKPFDECRRLGLTPEWESAVRKSFPKETGMLVAEIVLPEGPSDNKIEEGDVLVKVNGELLTQFVRLDDILDSSVGANTKNLTRIIDSGDFAPKVSRDARHRLDNLIIVLRLFAVG